MLAEQGGVAKTKTQQKQLDRIRHIGVSKLVGWMIAISLKEIALRSGEEEFAPLPFFISLLKAKE